MSAEAAVSTASDENDQNQLLFQMLAHLKESAFDAEFFANNAMEAESDASGGKPLGQALKQELKSMRMQREQKENSPASTTSSTPIGEASSDAAQSKPVKRRRPKRNPVWAYFDVVDGVAKCQRCPYSTKSVFSTNLKVHLKSHHTLQFNEVIRAEYHLNHGGSSEKPVIMGVNVLPSGRRDNEVTKNHPLVGSLLSDSKSTVPETADNVPLSNNSLLAAALQSLPSTFINIDQFKESSPSPDVNDRIRKRRRLRRHPVWQYFDDLDDKNIGCNMCDFKTVSGYTTNLKMHLRAHHKDEFVRVMELECQQRKEEGCVDNAPGGWKRRRRTAEEISRMLDQYKEKIKKDREDDDSDTAFSGSFDSSLLSGLNMFNQDSAAASPIPETLLEESESPVQQDDLCQFRNFMTAIEQMDQLSNGSPSIVKQARDLALGRVINEMGVHNIAFFTSHAFKQLMIAMDPKYHFSSDESELKQLAENACSSSEGRQTS